VAFNQELKFQVAFNPLAAIAVTGCAFSSAIIY